VLLRHGKDDALAWQLARSVLAADFPEFLPLLAQRVRIRDGLLQLRAPKVDVVGVDALLEQLVALFLGQIHAVNALALKLRLGGIEHEVNQVLLPYRLLVAIVVGGDVVGALELQESVAVDEVGGRGGQPHHARVEVAQHLVPAVEDRAVHLVEDD
jgi:hypothetical protein